MKVFYLFIIVVCSCFLIHAQPGLEVIQGSNLWLYDGSGRIIVGSQGAWNMGIDEIGIQTRYNNDASSLFINNSGGNIHMLGSNNLTGDLYIDQHGLYYNNTSERIGLGTTSPLYKLHVHGGDALIHSNGDNGRGLRLFQSAQGIHANLDIEQAGGTGELIYNMSVNFANGGGIRNSSYAGAVARIDTRVGASTQGFRWFWIPVNSSEKNIMTLTPFGDLLLASNMGNGLVIKNHNTWSHFTGDQNFGSGGSNFIIASKEQSDESAGIYGDGNNLTFWSAGDGVLGQPGAYAYFLDEDNFNSANTSPYDAGALKAYINTSGAWVISDKNKKENILKIQNSLEKIKKLDGYRYDYIRSERELAKNATIDSSIGLMAQDLKTIIPEAVQINDAGEHFVNYDMLIPYLIEAIKEQQTMIDQLLNKLD